MRRKFFGTKRRKIATLFVLLALLLAGVATGAAWYFYNGSGTGNGQGSFQNANNVAVTITVTGVAGGVAVGPGAAGEAKYDLSQTSAFPLTIQSITPNATEANILGTTCTTPQKTTAANSLNSSFSPDDGVGALIPASPTVLHTKAAVIIAANSPACLAGGTFTLPLTVVATAQDTH